MFDTNTYLKRRKELSSNMESGLILLPGNEEAPMNYRDNTYHFRQDSTFLYYFGLDQPSLIGVIDADSGESILFGDELSIDMIVWMGVLPSLKSRAGLSGITDVRPMVQLAAKVSKAMEQGRKVHFLPPYREDILLKIAELCGIPYQSVGNEASLDLIKAVVSQREIKSEEEVAELDHAVNISADMHLAAMHHARPGMRESEVAAKVIEVAHAANGETSFPVIATINGQTLHNHYHGNVIQKGDLFLLDAGFETEKRYAGDLSSTFPVARGFTQVQKEMYELSLDTHLAAVAALKPGQSFKEVHLAACRTIFEGLKGFGLTRGSTEEAVAAGAHAMFFPCGTGHMMGLDVHDMENLGEQWVGYDGVEKSTQFGLKSLRLAKPLKPGFVVTIEPGIYFIPELMDLWEAKGLHKDFLIYNELKKFRDFGGMRNEEDFLITEGGARRLGKALPLSVEGVEALRQY